MEPEKRAYKELYPVGARVRIAEREVLDDFRRTWKHHHPIQDEQLLCAGQQAKVEEVCFYHGGDVIYLLENKPGLWHECCLMVETKDL